MTTTAPESPLIQDELARIHSELQRGLYEEVSLGREQEALLLNDDYYLQIAYMQNDLDKMRVFEKLFVTFRTEIHLVESVVDILRDDLGYAEAAPLISAERITAYRIVVDSFAGLSAIPAGAVMRAAVQAVDAPEQAGALAAGIRRGEFV